VRPRLQTFGRGTGWQSREDQAAGAVIARPKRPGGKRKARPSGPKVTDDAPKQSMIEMLGTVKQVYPSTLFGVELENGHTVLAHIAGRLRRHHIKLLLGDRVELEISPYDLTKGRIVYRYRAGEARRTSAF
jgi:translation initiation factor IF-1